MTVASCRVDLRNPGQVLACCGLLELADRYWRNGDPPEAWFGEDRFYLEVPRDDLSNPLRVLLEELAGCEICPPLTEEEHEELRRSRRLGGRDEPSRERQRRKQELENRWHAGAIRLGAPFNMVVDWWLQDGATFKTWAGGQSVYQIARVCQTALRNLLDGTVEIEDVFDCSAVLRFPDGGSRRARNHNPSGFDARRAYRALDIGFSPDVLGLKWRSFPAVELLALIGLQRFRPAPLEPGGRDVFVYRTWHVRLPVSVASVVFSGIVAFPRSRRWRFQRVARDEQNRYKGLSYSEEVEIGHA